MTNNRAENGIITGKNKVYGFERHVAISAFVVPVVGGGAEKEESRQEKEREREDEGKRH